MQYSTVQKLMINQDGLEIRSQPRSGMQFSTNQLQAESAHAS
jgi:hypothetical protein